MIKQLKQSWKVIFWCRPQSGEEEYRRYADFIVPLGSSLVTVAKTAEVAARDAVPEGEQFCGCVDLERHQNTAEFIEVPGTIPEDIEPCGD